MNPSEVQQSVAAHRFSKLHRGERHPGFSTPLSPPSSSECLRQSVSLREMAGEAKEELGTEFGRRVPDKTTAFRMLATSQGRQLV